MKKLFFILMCVSSAVFADCDISRFRWDCALTIHPKPTREARSLVFCGASYGYLTEKDFRQLMHYKRRSISMVLKINGEFVTAPCYPAEKYLP